MAKGEPSRVWLIGLLVAVVALGTAAVYCNRVKLRRMGGGEAAEVIEAVQRRFAPELARFVVTIDEAAYKQRSIEAKGDPPLPIAGKVVVLEMRRSGEDWTRWSAEKVHPWHFDVRRKYRADDPAEVNTVLWYDQAFGYTTYEGKYGSRTEVRGYIHAYNQSTGTYARKRVEGTYEEINETFILLVER